MDKNFILVGLSHKTAPVSVRENLVVPEQDLSQHLHDLVSHEYLREALILSTCNRTEIYVIAKDIQQGIETVSDKFTELGNGLGQDLGKMLYVMEGERAIHHFFRVTASLDAMVIGESQILGQVREAYLLAEQAGTAGTFLNYLAPKAFHGAKKVRSDTEIAHRPVSVSYVAVQLAEQIFGDLSEKKVLLIGAGEMVKLAAKHFQEKKVSGLLITNRTREKAEHLAEDFQASVVPFENFSTFMDGVDIVIASTDAKEHLITAAQVQEVMRRRKNRPMFFIDMAVPRNIEPKINQLPNVYLYDMDDFQSIIDDNLAVRQKEAVEAEEIVKRELVQFLDYLRHRSMAPTISQLSHKIEMIRSQEAERLLAKSLNWSDEQKKAVEEGTRAIANKILHDPIVTLKTEGLQEEGYRTVDFIKKLFRLDTE
jgi:glutamyl-tRNA reductase